MPSINWSLYLGHFQTALLYGLVPIAVMVVLLHGLLWASTFRRTDEHRAILQFHCLPFTALGVLTGMFTGASRTAVVGVIVPPVLTFISGLAAYVLGKDAKPIWRRIVPLAIAMMTFGTMFGAAFGASMRQANEERDRQLEREKLRYEKVELPFMQKAVEKGGSTPAPASANPGAVPSVSIK
ncbi:MAG TPA: hypothetical protein PK264_01735 [Hyphomicrobiaceae bacterium]|nr:hypothetical protein [Hyphomicrobiaceae bacterium]